jgi:hypothetical protein
LGRRTNEERLPHPTAELITRARERKAPLLSGANERALSTGSSARACPLLQCVGERARVVVV